MIHVDPAQVGSHPLPAEPPPTGGPAQARVLIERQLAMLTRLAEIGMELAEAAGRQATGAAGESDAPPLGDPALAYSRVARAVRMTIALQSRLMNDLADLDRAEDKAESARAATRRSRLHRLVERAIEAEHADNEALDRGAIRRLSFAACERLTDAEADADIAGLPFAEVVARICADLGLSPEWTARLVAVAGGPQPPPRHPRAEAEGWRPEDPAAQHFHPTVRVDPGAAGSSGLRRFAAAPEDDEGAGDDGRAWSSA